MPHVLLVLMVLAQTVGLGHRIVHNHPAAGLIESSGTALSQYEESVSLLAALFSHSSNISCDSWDAALSPDGSTATNSISDLPMVLADRVFHLPTFSPHHRPHLSFTFARAPPPNRQFV